MESSTNHLATAFEEFALTTRGTPHEQLAPTAAGSRTGRAPQYVHSGTSRNRSPTRREETQPEAIAASSLPGRVGPHEDGMQAGAGLLRRIGSLGHVAPELVEERSSTSPCRTSKRPSGLPTASDTPHPQRSRLSYILVRHVSTRSNRKEFSQQDSARS